MESRPDRDQHYPEQNRSARSRLRIEPSKLFLLSISLPYVRRDHPEGGLQGNKESPRSTLRILLFLDSPRDGRGVFWLPIIHGTTAQTARIAPIASKVGRQEPATPYFNLCR